MAEAQGVSRRFVGLLTLACGLTVANLYYAQPLLNSVAATFGVSKTSTGALVSATQIGYAVGLVLLVPLGDMVRRRPLVCGLLLVDAVALVASATAGTLPMLVAAGAAVGVTSVVVQILVPYAATVATNAQRSRVIATLLTGMLVAVLLSRTLAGLIAQVAGWRTVFAVAAVFMVGAAAILYRLLPAEPPEVAVTYAGQMRAIAGLVRREPVLRRRSVMGACAYAAFNCFWTTSAFLLVGAPYRFAQWAIGLFGLVGVAGALSAKLVGRVGAPWQSPASGIGLAALALSFAALGVGGHQFVTLVVAVIVLDAAVQGVHLLNQSVIYELSSRARARLTTVYMTSYFIGGSLGSAGGALGYAVAGWVGACVAGGLFAVVGLLTWYRDARARPAGHPDARHLSPAR